MVKKKIGKVKAKIYDGDAEYIIEDFGGWSIIAESLMEDMKKGVKEIKKAIREYVKEMLDDGFWFYLSKSGMDSYSIVVQNEHLTGKLPSSTLKELVVDELNNMALDQETPSAVYYGIKVLELELMEIIELVKNEKEIWINDHEDDEELKKCLKEDKEPDK